MRGGILYIAERHSKGNNKHIRSYDNSKSSKYIAYLDDWVNSQYFPYGRFEWLSQKEIDKFNVNSIKCDSIKENSSDGYILEVDLKYPDKLDELYNDYPLAPKKLKINHCVLSNCCSNIVNDYRIRTGKVNKLVPNLDTKSKFVLHYRNL